MKKYWLLVLLLSSTLFYHTASAEAGCPDNIVISNLIDVPFAIMNGASLFFTGHYIIADLPMVPC